MLEKPGFSAMRPIVVESVRKRILPPLGSWAKSQTGGRNRSFKRNGKRRSAGLSSLNQGNPKTSRRTSGKAMRWRTGICSALAGRKVVALSTTGSIRSQREDRTRISCKAFSAERCVLVRDDVKMKQVWHLSSPSSALQLNCFSREWLDRRFGARHRAVIAEGSHYQKHELPIPFTSGSAPPPVGHEPKRKLDQPSRI